MPNRRLKLESGELLDPSDWIDQFAAREATKVGVRVLLWSYPRTVDITDEPHRVAELVGRVQTDELIPETYSARIYSHGADRVLVIEHHH